MKNPRSFIRILLVTAFICSNSNVWSQNNTGESEFAIYQTALAFHENRENKKADSTLNRLNIPKFLQYNSSLCLDVLQLKAKLKHKFFETDSSIYYYQKAIQKARLLGNNEIMSHLYRKISSPFMRNRMADSAFYYMDMSIQLDSINNPKRFQSGLHRKADMLWAIGKTDQALKLLDRCYELAIKENNYSNVQNILMHIGRIYMNVGEYEKAEQYMLQSQQVAKQNNLDVEVYINYRKTILYTFWKKWEKADSVNQLAINATDSMETPVFFSNLMLQAGRIAMYTGKYDLAQHYGQRAENIRMANRTNDGLAKIYLFKARLHTQKEEYELANFWMDSSLYYGEEIFDPLIRVRIYHQKALISLYLDQDENYHKYITKYNGINDSIGGVKNVKAINDREMELAIQAHNKEKEALSNQLSEKEQQHKKTVILGVVISVLIVFIAVVLWVRYRKKSATKEAELIFEKEKAERELLNQSKKIQELKESGQALEDLPEHFEPLSKREKEVFELLVQGLSDKEIAEKLFISLPTVRTHTRHIYEKFHINSRMEAKDISLKYKVL